MVIKDNPARRDRGQLVLIGAIAIAFILLGIVVVFNGVQYTETVSSGSAGEDLEEVRMVESELQTGIQTMAENGETIDNTTVEAYVENVYQPEKAEQGPVYVSYQGNFTSSGNTVSFDVTYATTEITVTRTVEVTLP